MADVHSGLQGALAEVALLGPLLVLELGWLTWLLLSVFGLLVVHSVLVGDAVGSPVADRAGTRGCLRCLQELAWLGLGVLMGRHAGAGVLFVGKEFSGDAAAIVSLYEKQGQRSAYCMIHKSMEAQPKIGLLLRNESVCLRRRYQTLLTCSRGTMCESRAEPVPLVLFCNSY